MTSAMHNAIQRFMGMLLPIGRFACSPLWGTAGSKSTGNGWRAPGAAAEDGRPCRAGWQIAAVLAPFSAGAAPGWRRWQTMAGRFAAFFAGALPRRPPYDCAGWGHLEKWLQTA